LPVNPKTTADDEGPGGPRLDEEMAADRAPASRSLLVAASLGYAISLALFIVPLVHFVAIPAAPAVGSVIASSMLADPRRWRRALALVLTLLWELPVAGVGFITGWSGPVIALIAVGVAIWAFGLSLLGSLMADRVNSYATKRWRGRKATGGSQGPVEKDRPAR
jgi:hypothetical protein